MLWNCLAVLMFVLHPPPPLGPSTFRVSLSRLLILMPFVSTRQLRFPSVEIPLVYSICEFVRVAFLWLRI